MAGDVDAGSLERLLDERGQHLLRAAVALAGSRADGEDLLQAALAPSPDRSGGLSAAHPVSPGRRWLACPGPVAGQAGEFRAQAPAEPGGGDVAAVDVRDELVRLLHRLPPRQRAVIVLRYWEQYTEAETAALLGCSEGTVKSAAARGLRRLREVAAPRQEPEGGPAQGSKSRPGTPVKVAEGRS